MMGAIMKEVWIRKIESTFRVNGGFHNISTVSVYGEAGWQRDLAPLNQGRYNHACGSYVNGGKKVNPIM